MKTKTNTHFVEDFMKSHSVFFHHTKFDEENPHTYRATVAAILEGNELHCGVALCTPTDNFSRAVGRSKALGRAIGTKTRKSFTLQASDLADPKTKIRSIKTVMVELGESIVEQSNAGLTPSLKSNNLYA